MPFSSAHWNAALAIFLAVPAVWPAEMDIVDRLSVNGYTAFKDTVTFSGSVGIGTAIPSAKLEIRTSTDIAFAFAIGTSAAASVIISTSGSMGVGTVSPKTMLDVAGGIRISSDTSACNADNAGIIRWYGGHFQGCIGSAWRQLDNQAPPTIVSVTPSSQPFSGGGTVVIRGSYFAPLGTLSVGEVPVSSFTFVSSSEIRAALPAANSLGAKDVVFQNFDGQSATLAGAVIYLADGSRQDLADLSCRKFMDNGGSRGSGTYWIDPNGGSVSDAFQVYCDMTTDGGGWSEVFSAAVDNYNDTNINYASGTAGPNSLISNSAYMLFAFIDNSNNALSYAWKFPTPSVFYSLTPMSATSCGYVNINATRISDGLAASKVLRYGTGSFGSYCDQGCSSQYGQICLKSVPDQGTLGGYLDFPMLIAYASSAGDYCTGSDQAYNAGSCSSSRRFVIFVR